MSGPKDGRHVSGRLGQARTANPLGVTARRTEAVRTLALRKSRLNCARKKVISPADTLGAAPVGSCFHMLGEMGDAMDIRDHQERRLQLIWSLRAGSTAFLIVRQD